MTAVFDFEAEVEKARAEYPAETKDITFIHVNDEDAVEQLAKAFESMTPVYRRWLLETDGESVSSLAAEMILSDISTFSTRDPFNGKAVLVFDPLSVLTGIDVGRQAMKRFAFRHELAHMLINEANGAQTIASLTQYDIANADDHPQVQAILDEEECLHENICDTFAAISGLKEKWLRPEEVSAIALDRARTSLFHRDVTHLTTLALDKLVLGDRDANFVSLTPQEIKKIAAEHGRLYTPEAAEAEKIRTMLHHKTCSLRTAMTRVLTGKSTAKGEYACHLATRILENELTNDNKIPAPERHRITAILKGGRP